MGDTFRAVAGGASGRSGYDGVGQKLTHWGSHWENNKTRGMRKICSMRTGLADRTRLRLGRLASIARCGYRGVWNRYVDECVVIHVGNRPAGLRESPVRRRAEDPRETSVVWNLSRIPKDFGEMFAKVKYFHFGKHKVDPRTKKGYTNCGSPRKVLDRPCSPLPLVKRQHKHSAGLGRQSSSFF